MKKIYIAAAAMLACSLGYSQSKTAQDHGQGIPSIWHSPVQTKGATIFSEDFNSGIPATWSNVTVSGPVDWKYTTVGHTGAYPTATLMSTTASNGWAIVDSDADNFSGGGAEDAQLTTDVIDCSGFSNVKLEFQQMFRRWQSDITTVRVTTDGGANWTDFVLNANIDQSGTDNPDYVNIDISAAIAGNPANVQIMFWWQGAWDYGWQIDDIAVKEIDPNDVIVKRPSFDADIEYYQIPQNHIQAQNFHAWVSNIGYTDQTNVTLDVDVNDGSSSVFTGSSAPVATLAVGNEDSLAITTSFTPSGMGTYTVTFSASQDETDDEPTNNTATDSYEVTDSVYALDNGNYGGQWWNQNAGGSGSDPYEIGGVFEIMNDDNTGTASVYVGDSTDVGAAFILKIYQYNAGSQAYDYLMETDIYTVDTPDLDNWVTIPWLSHVPLAAGETYLVSLEHFGGTSRVFVGYGTNTSFRGSTLSHDGDGTWANQPRTPMIRLNLNPSLSVNDLTAGFELEQNMPNPSNDVTTISYTIENSNEVALTITDIAGKVVLNRTEGIMSAGTHNIVVNTAAMNAGVYFYTLSVGGQKATKQMIVK